MMIVFWITAPDTCSKNQNYEEHKILKALVLWFTEKSKNTFYTFPQL